MPTPPRKSLLLELTRRGHGIGEAAARATEPARDDKVHFRHGKRPGANPTDPVPTKVVTRAMKRALRLLFLTTAVALGACTGSEAGRVEPTSPPLVAEPETAMKDRAPDPSPALATATLGGGCFWCVEAVLERVDGVASVDSGYMGGSVDNPTYRQICEGDTGHAEVVQVRYDPTKIDYRALLDWFFQAHDPTTLNQQGNDYGTQYRSVIFVHDEEQARIAREAKAAANEKFGGRVVTEIAKASTFWIAEDYHQDYFAKNPRQSYCLATIPPKLKKLGLDQKPRAGDAK